MTPDECEALPAALCECHGDRVTCHCGTCGRIYQRCVECQLPTRANRCQCRGRVQRHPDHPEEWA